MASFLLPNLVRFVRVLRAAGLDVPAGAAMDAGRALSAVGLDRRDDVRTALRTVLVRRRDDLALFDMAFDAFFRPRRRGETLRDLRAMGEKRHFRPPEAAADGGEMREPRGGGASTSAAPSGATRGASWSDREALGHKDFAAFTDDEAADARAFLQSLRWSPDSRRTHRWTRGRGSRLDMARLLRRSLRHGGEVIHLPRKSRRTDTRPLVVLCDVSGSMEPYSRMLLHFVHVMASRRPRVEVFLFATRLARVTRQAAHRRSHALTDALGALVPDFAGGTRIGDALGAFNRQWARRVLRHDPVVLILSDGWDRGDPAVLAHEMARLARSCHRVIWLNPLMGDPDFAPLARGMQAALPHVDDLLPVHSLDSLAALAAHLNTLPRRTTPAGGHRPRAHTAAPLRGPTWT
ncbi:MAG: VWA domain-containing protein [Vicinamibacterales bacterium]